MTNMRTRPYERPVLVRHARIAQVVAIATSS
jgi:hypothetical protein